MAVQRNLFVIVCASILLVASQEALARADTTRVSSDTTDIEVSEEIVLDEIFIEAVIEKPNVAILPTRVKTEYGDVEFIDRSFKHELKEGPDKLLFMDVEFELAKKLKKLKEILEREKRSK